jgi:hypothetical protein
MIHWLLVLGGLGLAPSSSGRLKDDDVKKLMEEAKNDVERFEDRIDKQYRGAKIRSGSAEVAIDGFLKDLKKAAENMRDRFQSDYSASAEALTFLRKAKAIDTRAAAGGGLFGAEKEWPRLQSTLVRLSRVYGVDWGGSGDGWTARRMNDQELQQAIEKYAKNAEFLKKSLEEALKHVSSVSKEERKSLMGAVDRLSDVSDDLKGKVGDGKDPSADLGRLDAATGEIQSFLEKHDLTSAVGPSFRTLTSELSAIAAACR